MKKYITYAMTALFATIAVSIAAPDKDAMMALEKELDSMKKWDMKSFSFSDFNVVFPDADTATMTYTVTVEGTSEGKDASGTYNAGSVWRKHNGEWHAVFHTNTKEEKPASQ